MMTAVNFNMRLDSELKEQATVVLENYGLSVPQALKLFLNQVVKTNSVPLTFDWGKNATTEPVFNYDLVRMQSKMQGLENPNERLLHGIEIPNAESPEQLLAWLNENLPQHLHKAGA